MSNDPAKLLRSAAFRSTLTANTPAHLKPTVERIHAYLLEEGILSENHTIRLKGTSILDMGILLMAIELLGDKATSVIMLKVFGCSKLTVKNWIDRLRGEDGMCDIPWEKDNGPVKGNIGRFVVQDWGVFNKEVYLPFEPYVKMAIEHSLAVIEKSQAKAKK